MTDERKPTQAMPTEEQRGEKPRPTQPMRAHDKTPPKEDDDDFGGFMGHGGQTDMGYEGPGQTEDEEDNPNAAADPD